MEGHEKLGKKMLHFLVYHYFWGHLAILKDVLCTLQRCVSNWTLFVLSLSQPRPKRALFCYDHLGEIPCQVCAFLYLAKKSTMTWILISYREFFFWKNSIEINFHWTVINYVRNYVLCLTKNRMAGKRFECGTVVKIGPFSCGRIQALRYLVGFYHHHNV